PLFRWSIPAALVGPPLLLLLPSTRALAIAALPHLLFILFGARHKQVNYTGYLAPEIALYLAATLSVGLTAVFALASRLRRGRLVATIGTAGVAAALIATEVPSLVIGDVRRTSGLYDFEVGRAAARLTVGPDAVVGAASAGVWYTGGATHLYFVNPDIID